MPTEQPVNKSVSLNNFFFQIRGQVLLEVSVLTFTLETLPHETPQHLPAVVAERRGFVGVHVQSMRTDLKVFNSGKSCSTNKGNTL